MRIDHIVVLLADLTDHLLGTGIITAIAGKQLLQLLLDLVANLILALLGKLSHIGTNFFVILSQRHQQTLQVAGNQDVHGRRTGVIKSTVAVIFSGTDEISQDVIAVGCTDKLVERHTHLTGVESGQNIAEVAGGNANIHRFPGLHTLITQQVTVGGNVVDDLRQHTTPVNGVCRRQEVAALCQLLTQLFIGEQPLDTGLGIVKVSVHRANTHVVTLLGEHLQLLNGRNAILRIEHQDTGAIHILEAFQRTLSGITGSGNQNADGLLLLGLYQGRGQQMGQHLQSHVLKGAGRAMPQLQTEGILIQGVNRSHSGRIKLFRAIGGTHKIGQFLYTELVQKQLHNVNSSLLVGHILQLVQGLTRKFRQISRSQQTSIVSQTFCNCLRGTKNVFAVSGTDILHMYQSLIIIVVADGINPFHSNASL